MGQQVAQFHVKLDDEDDDNFIILIQCFVSSYNEHMKIVCFALKPSECTISMS